MADDMAFGPIHTEALVPVRAGRGTVVHGARRMRGGHVAGTWLVSWCGVGHNSAPVVADGPTVAEGERVTFAGHRVNVAGERGAVRGWAVPAVVLLVVVPLLVLLCSCRPTYRPAPCRVVEMTSDTAAWLDYRGGNPGRWVDERTGTVVGWSQEEDGTVWNTARCALEMPDYPA